MASVDFFDELEDLAQSADFEAASYALSERWLSTDVGVEAVEPIFRFMETHPNVDFGAPGPLVHFVERFFGAGYEEKLLESLERRPTQHTAWMMNRIINATGVSSLTQGYIAVLRRARLHPNVDWNTRKEIDSFLEKHPP